MEMKALSSTASRLPFPATDPAELKAQQLQAGDTKDKQLRETFDTFVGETFYGQLLSQMRKTVGKSPYFNGGRAEEIFQGQLDQRIASDMAKANAHSFSGPMFELFALSQK